MNARIAQVVEARDLQKGDTMLGDGLPGDGLSARIWGVSDGPSGRWRDSGTAVWFTEQEGDYDFEWGSPDLELDPRAQIVVIR